MYVCTMYLKFCFAGLVAVVLDLEADFEGDKERSKRLRRRGDENTSSTALPVSRQLPNLEGLPIVLVSSLFLLDKSIAVISK